MKASSWLLASLFLLPTQVAAHGVFEASELETHLLNDEGSDAIEPYGGYDINELFIGFAHDASVGEGAKGDGLYFRLEVYGLMANGPPLPSQAWTLQITANTPTGSLVRTMSTTDGTTFTGDFEGSIVVQVDTAERATHIQRAFISFAKAGLAPGDSIGPFKVESRVNGDLRDVAPGGIPVPGTNGAATYPEPTALPGKGSLVDSVKLLAPDLYVSVTMEGMANGSFNITVKSALKKGGQHVFIQPAATEGWTYTLNGTTAKPLAANGSLSFTLRATPTPNARPLRLDVVTDLGGRAELLLGTDSVLQGPRDASASLPPAPAKTSPPAGLLLVLAALGLAALRRR